MKKGLLIFGMVLLITGCGNKNEKYQNAMKESASKYYEMYMKGVKGQTENEITLKALKDANKKLGENYDLSELGNCKETSSVLIVVDDETREIKKITYNLDCK